MSISFCQSAYTCTLLGRDACQSDSGGPLTWLDPKTQTRKLIGVVSFGKGQVKISAWKTEVSNNSRATTQCVAFQENQKTDLQFSGTKSPPKGT